MIWLLSIFLLQKQVLSLDFSKNACNNLYDYPFASIDPYCYHNPNVLSDTPSMAQQNGYSIETHNPITKDGYILTLYHILPPNSNQIKSKKPVFILHGIAADSSIWVCTNNESLAFYLTDNGYDVWLGNFRGVLESSQHLKYKRSDPSFWTFNLDDIAKNDINTFLTYISKQNNYGKIIYIGHSMGTTLALMYAAEFPKKAELLIDKLILLSPVEYLASSLTNDALFPFFKVLTNALLKFQITALFVNQPITKIFFQLLSRFFPYLATEIIDRLFGKSNIFDPKLLTTFYSYFATTTSTMVLIQYINIYLTKQFIKYDFGKDKNLKIYNQTKPPIYNLENIKIPTYLFYGLKDATVSSKTAQKTFQELGSFQKSLETVPIGRKQEEELQFGHIEMVMGKNIVELFYHDLLAYLKK